VSVLGSATPAADGGSAATRVLLVDDHAVVRAAVRHVLAAEDGVEVVAEAGSAERAVAEARRHQPDVVVMDLHMPSGDGVAGMPDVLRAAPQARILVLTMRADRASVRASFAAGASGYVLKEAADTELVAAVRAVASGAQYVQAALGAQLLVEQSEAHARPDDGLSQREREVARLLALGHSNQEISRMLWISPRTAETHRAHVMRKLGISTRAELVRHALRTGLLDAEPADG
jgi:two-component system, NarL family, response regulator NreC